MCPRVELGLHHENTIHRGRVAAQARGAERALIELSLLARLHWLFDLRDPLLRDIAWEHPR